MRHRGKIIAFNTESGTTEYGIVCLGGKGVFSFPVEERDLLDLIKTEGEIFEREIEYDDELKTLMFLD
jgi:hypothetical protein